MTRVVYGDGTSPAAEGLDPVLGTLLADAADQAEAKLVDLDPEHQMVSGIWGFRVHLCGPGGARAFEGKYRVATFKDFWIRAQGPGPGGDAPAGAHFQSVLEDVVWGDLQGSRFLQELKAATERPGAVPGKLSIKFNMDGVDLDSTSPGFTWGRLVGSIGPVFEGEPPQFVRGRILRLAEYPWLAANPLNYAYCVVDRAARRLSLDLGNSLPTSVPGGPISIAGYDQFQLQAAPPDGANVNLADLSFGGDDWYPRTAGIVDIILSDEALDQAARAPLAILANQSQGSGVSPLLRENPQGLYVNAHDCVFRLNAGETARVELLVTRFGEPSAGQKITLRLDPELVYSLQNPLNPPSIPIGVPASALKLPRPAATGPDGRVTFDIVARDPGNPRQFIDGQVYGVAYTLEEMGPSYSPNRNNFLSFLVWTKTTWEGKPTWHKDIRPVLKQYARLYPVMGLILDLGDYASVMKHRGVLRYAFTLPKEDPVYMPTTRDLSRSKLAMLLEWLNDPIEGDSV